MSAFLVRRFFDRLGNVPTLPEDMRAFFQRRVAFFVALCATLWLVTRAIDFLIGTIIGHDPWMVIDETCKTTQRNLHGLTGIALLAVAGILLRVRLPARMTACVELAVTLFQVSIFCIMISASPLNHRPDLAMLLGCAHVLVIRAALVPSKPRDTALIGTVASGIVGGCSYWMWKVSPPDSLYVKEGSLPLINTIIWGVVAIVGTTAVSFVVYGLQKRVEQAAKLGQYTLLGKLGEGGMGVVYRARHALLRRPTAVKVLRAADGAMLDNFEREVQLTAEITHPNIVSVYDFGRSPEGAFYYAMEFLDGIDLERLVEEGGPLPPARVAHVLVQVADALAEAHAVGLIHRDIKPANIILCANARRPDLAKVVDFGLVKELGAPNAPVIDGRGVTGTPLYMAPEAIRGGSDIDARSDLYALGAVGYFLLTGEPVFDGKTVVEVCGAHLHKAVVPPSRRVGSAIPAALEALILRCLAKAPADRPESADALVAELRALNLSWRSEQARAWWSTRGQRETPPASGTPSNGAGFNPLRLLGTPGRLTAAPRGIAGSRGLR